MKHFFSLRIKVTTFSAGRMIERHRFIEGEGVTFTTAVQDLWRNLRGLQVAMGIEPVYRAILSALDLPGRPISEEGFEVTYRRSVGRLPVYLHGRQWAEDLHRLGLLYHLDDGPQGGGADFTLEEMAEAERVEAFMSDEDRDAYFKAAVDLTQQGGGR